MKQSRSSLKEGKYKKKKLHVMNQKGIYENDHVKDINFCIFNFK